MNKENTINGFDLDEQRLLFQAGRHSLMDFSILTNAKYKPNWHHEILANELEKMERNEVDWKILIVMMPPRSGKSEETTINFPAWYLGRNPDKEIITSSYSADLATDFGGKTRNLICSNEYKMIFPEMGLQSDEKSKAKWKTNKKGSYTSTGIGGAITGRGANIFIIDDPIKNFEEADSQVIRQKHWDWFTSTAYTRLNPGGKIVLILTRWHLDDLAGRILENEELSSRTKIISFPAIAREDEKNRKKGEVLWPERYSLKEMESTRRSIGASVFASLYQQTPILSENQEFKPKWIKYIEWEDICKVPTRNFLTVDTAISKKASADFTGIVCNFVDKQNNWNIKTYKKKIDPKELMDFLFKLDAAEGYEKIGIEKTVYLDAIKPFLDDEMRRRGRYLNIVPLEHKQTAKETRIRGLIPRYSNGTILHIKEECEGLEEELLAFPKGKHDDVIDALAYQVQITETLIEENWVEEDELEDIATETI